MNYYKVLFTLYYSSQAGKVTSPLLIYALKMEM